MRTAGILMPITSLPSPYGVGTLGQCARDFIQFLHRAGQNILADTSDMSNRIWGFPLPVLLLLCRQSIYD